MYCLILISNTRSCYHPFVFDTDTNSWRMLAHHEWLLSVEARKASRNAASLRCQLAWRHVNGMPQSTCSVIVLENCMVPSCSIYSRHHECLATRHDWAWAYRTALWDPVLPGRGRDSSLLCRGWSLCECWSSHWWCDAQSVSGLMLWTIVNCEAMPFSELLSIPPIWSSRPNEKVPGLMSSAGLDGMLVSVGCLSTQHNPETQHAFSMKCWIYCGLFSYRIPFHGMLWHCCNLCEDLWILWTCQQSSSKHRAWSKNPWISLKSFWFRLCSTTEFLVKSWLWRNEYGILRFCSLRYLPLSVFALKSPATLSWYSTQKYDLKSTRTEGAEVFFVCAHYPEAIAIAIQR